MSDAVRTLYGPLVSQRYVTDAAIYTAHHRFMVVKNDPFPSSIHPGRSIESRGIFEFSLAFRAIHAFGPQDPSGVKGVNLARYPEPQQNYYALRL